MPRSTTIAVFTWNALGSLASVGSRERLPASRTPLRMTQAQTLAVKLNADAKSPQFGHSKARATARKDGNVDWDRTKVTNEGFNPDVDGCETFVMNDGSTCVWKASSRQYGAVR